MKSIRRLWLENEILIGVTFSIYTLIWFYFNDIEVMGWGIPILTLIMFIGLTILNIVLAILAHKKLKDRGIRS